MSWNVINLDAVTSTPWKNGRGVTRELVAWPNADEWIWRMSVAEVAQSGPFSRFEGVQRWFAVVSGAGVKLHTDGVLRTVGSGSDPICFDGAAATDCELIDDTTQDFNLMVRGDQIRTQMLRIAEPIEIQISDSTTIAVFAMKSRARIEFNSLNIEIDPGILIWRDVKRGDQIRVNATCALLITIEDQQQP